METINVVVQLLDWSEGKRGRKIVLEIMDEGAGDHPFKQYTARNGKIAGQLFGAAFVEIDPATERPVERNFSALTHDQKKAWDTMTPGQRVHTWARDPLFLEYTHAQSYEDAVNEIRAAFEVDSLSEINADPLKRKRFAEFESGWEKFRSSSMKAPIGGK